MFAGLQRVLGDLFEFQASQSGLFIFATWKGAKKTFQTFMKLLDANQLAPHQDTAYFVSTGITKGNCQKPNSVVFGFSHLSIDEINDAILRIERLR